MPVAFNEHAHQPSKAWKGEGEGRGWGTIKQNLG